jgi:ribosomal protein L40E
VVAQPITPVVDVVAKPATTSNMVNASSLTNPSVNQMSNTVLCTKCGASNDKGTHFCTKCGFTLNQLHAQQSVNTMTNPSNNSLPYHMQAPTDPNKGKGLAITSLVMGILACVCGGWFIFSALAIIFAACSVKSNYKGMAIAGLILGIVGIGITIWWIQYYVEILGNLRDTSSVIARLVR